LFVAATAAAAVVAAAAVAAVVTAAAVVAAAAVAAAVVAAAALEASWTPVIELNGALGLDRSNRSVDILDHHNNAAGRGTKNKRGATVSGFIGHQQQQSQHGSKTNRTTTITYVTRKNSALPAAAAAVVAAVVAVAVAVVVGAVAVAVVAAAAPHHALHGCAPSSEVALHRVTNDAMITTLTNSDYETCEDESNRKALA
jgi:hypothetical protein